MKQNQHTATTPAEADRAIPFDDIMIAIESANNEFGQCYDFRTKQTLFVGGDIDSFQAGFLSELAKEHPESVQELLIDAANSEELSLRELLGEESDIENAPIETIIGNLDANVLELLEETYLENCLSFPDPFEINDYGIMQRFIRDETKGETSDQLTDAIRGLGAFSHFKSMLTRLDMEQQWLDYRTNEYTKIAREWAEANQVRVIE